MKQIKLPHPQSPFQDTRKHHCSPKKGTYGRHVQFYVFMLTKEIIIKFISPVGMKMKLQHNGTWYKFLYLYAACIHPPTTKRKTFTAAATKFHLLFLKFIHSWFKIFYLQATRIKTNCKIFHFIWIPSFS